MNAPSALPGEPAVDRKLAAAHGLSDDEYQRIVQILGRTPTYSELGVFSASIFGYQI